MIPYSHLKTNYANPGAENYAFVPNMTLPAFAIQAGGNMQARQLNVLAGPQIVSMPQIPTAGYGGLVAGQIIGQPLIK